MEENINLLDQFYLPKVEKDFIDNSSIIKTLNENHIDSNEVLGIDKDKDAGTIQLQYKDEKEKEADGISFLEGLWEFTKDTPPSIYQSLKLALMFTKVQLNTLLTELLKVWIQKIIAKNI